MSQLKTVPVTPTKAMLKAGSDDLLLSGCVGTLTRAAECWRAMLAAAPEHQIQGPMHGRTQHPPPCPPAPPRPWVKSPEPDSFESSTLEPLKGMRMGLQPLLVNLICGLRRNQVERAIELLLDYIDIAAAISSKEGSAGD